MLYNFEDTTLFKKGKNIDCKLYVHKVVQYFHFEKDLKIFD